MIKDLEQLAEEAGKAIMKIYESRSFQIKAKSDRSPVTDADMLAHEIILQGLRKLSGLPIISEEEEPSLYAETPLTYWLVDPLDGTKEFIQRCRTFTVNIALIENGVPTIGVIAAPETGEVFSGYQGVFRRNAELQGRRNWSGSLILAASRSHPEPELETFKATYGIDQELRCGSSYKFCLVAMGEAHLYPRFRRLSAWDVAAGDAVARAAGCRVLSLAQHKPLEYAWHQRHVPPFCVLAPGVELENWPS